MKRSTMFIALVLACFGYTQNAQAQEYDPSASKELFDFSPFNETKLLNLFYDAQQQGRQYPTTAEFEAAGFNMMDIEFVRSHVRPIHSSTTRLTNWFPVSRIHADFG